MFPPEDGRAIFRCSYAGHFAAVAARDFPSSRNAREAAIDGLYEELRRTDRLGELMPSKEEFIVAQGAVEVLLSMGLSSNTPPARLHDLLVGRASASCALYAKSRMQGS